MNAERSEAACQSDNAVARDRAEKIVLSLTPDDMCVLQRLRQFTAHHDFSVAFARVIGAASTHKGATPITAEKLLAAIEAAEVPRANPKGSEVSENIKMLCQTDEQDFDPDKILLSGASAPALVRHMPVCRRCRSTRVSSEEPQIRRADEEPTALHTCDGCGYRWS